MAMGTKSASERVLTGRIGAYVLHSKYDSRELTKAAHAAFEGKFEREVDPDGVLPLEERLRRADMARKAHFARLALKSAQARRKRASRRAASPAAEIARPDTPVEPLEVPVLGPTSEGAVPRRPRRRRIRSPLETVAVPLSSNEAQAHAAWRERRRVLDVPADHVLRFATWYPSAIKRWMAKATEQGACRDEDHWDDGRDNYCRHPEVGLVHRTGDDRLIIHLEVEEEEAGVWLVARYCRAAGLTFPAPKWTDKQRLSFEELVAGVPCRGCGRGFEGGPEWKPIAQRTAEEQAALDVEEATFKSLHPDCGGTRWSISGGGITHCSVCCPPPPFGPEQTKKLARLLVVAAQGAAERDRELEQRWKDAESQVG